MPHRQKPSRRDFLAQGAAAGLALATVPNLAWAAPNERLNLAFIGVGGRGGHNLGQLASAGDNVVAVCDVDANAVGAAKSRYPAAETFADFRQLFDKMANKIDAVVVSTPEHTHAYATMPALQLGKHVYCEKPLTHNIGEARAITLAAAKAGVVTQMGTQIHGLPNYRRVVELVRSDVIGPITDVHVWVGRAWGRQSAAEARQHGDIVHIMERPAEAMTPPAHVDWDLWLGPAPKRPFHNVYLPGPKWYRWWAFGNGTMSDLGSHWVDLPYWALKLDAPKTVEAFGPEPHAEIAPASMRVVYEYGPRGDMPACKVTWYQGAEKPAILAERGVPAWGNGVLFIGERGMILSDYGKHVLLPEEQFTGFQRPEPFIPDSPGHHAQWLQACKTGGPTDSPFSYAGPLTEANHLGNVAYRAGQKLEWDAAAMKATNCPAADEFISREPRKGWSLG